MMKGKILSILSILSVESWGTELLPVDASTASAISTPIVSTGSKSIEFSAELRAKFNAETNEDILDEAHDLENVAYKHLDDHIRRLDKKINNPNAAPAIVKAAEYARRQVVAEKRYRPVRIVATPVSMTWGYLKSFFKAKNEYEQFPLEHEQAVEGTDPDPATCKKTETTTAISPRLQNAENKSDVDEIERFFKIRMVDYAFFLKNIENTSSIFLEDFLETLEKMRGNSKITQEKADEVNQIISKIVSEQYRRAAEKLYRANLRNNGLADQERESFNKVRDKLNQLRFAEAESKSTLRRRHTSSSQQP